MRETGVYQSLGDVNYFIPHSLPPRNPPLDLNREIMLLYGEANFALGKLNEMAPRLPDEKRFIKAYVIKEALLSSSIEGIHTTIIEIFTHLLEESKPDKNMQLVLNYRKALDAALSMLQDEELPLVSRVILRAHEVLMSSGEGGRSAPGSYRPQSVRVGNLVPPPATQIQMLMADLERYMNEESDLPPLIRIGLVHVHFESIHPFLDGNGRIGRLLIVLMLIQHGLLNLPILYLSYYFKKNHLEYYQRLDSVRTHGDFEGWIVYYLTAIRDSALDAHKRAKRIEELEKEIRESIRTDPNFSKIRDISNLVVDFLFMHPITGISQVSVFLNKSYNASGNIIHKFVQAGFVRENTEQKRNKLYHFEAYLNLLDQDL